MNAHKTEPVPLAAYRVLVTGGSGFIGTNLVRSLASDGFAVLNLDVAKPRDAAQLQAWRRIDVVDQAALTEAIMKFAPTHILHMAARTDLNSDRVDDYEANTLGVENVIAAAKMVPSLRRVVFASSRLVCRIGYQPKSDLDCCPTTAYGESKVVGEGIVRAMGTQHFSWVLVRPTSIWGPWFGTPYRNFFDHVRAGRYVHPSGLAVRKSFGYVGNTVFQVKRLMNADGEQVAGKTYYLADYEPIEVYRFATAVAREFGAGAVKQVPLQLLRLAARFGDLAKRLGYLEPPITSFRLDNMCAQMLHEFGDLPEITGALPYSMERGVVETAQWMRQTS